MMPMITSFITPEEAEFMTGFPTSAASLEEIAAMKEMDPAELAPKIEALCRKGLVYEAIRGDSSRYRLVLPFEMFLRVTFWDREGQGTYPKHGASCDQVLHGRLVRSVQALRPSRSCEPFPSTRRSRSGRRFYLSKMS